MRNKLILPPPPPPYKCWVLPLITLFLFACEKKIDKEVKEVLDNNNAPISSLIFKGLNKDTSAVTVDAEAKTSIEHFSYKINLKTFKIKNVSFLSSATCSIKENDHIPLTKDNAFEFIITAQNSIKKTYTIAINKLDIIGKYLLFFKFLKSVNNLNDDAFNNCSSFKRNLTIPNAITSIENYKVKKKDVVNIFLDVLIQFNI